MGLGILLGLLGSIMINIGNNVQALGMGMEAAQKQLDKCDQSKRPKVLWTTGTVTFIVGSVINFVAFVFAAASVLAPLEAIQFVSNLVFARYVTKVPVSRKMVAGSALIVAGTIGAVAGGPLTVTSFSISQLRGPPHPLPPPPPSTFPLRSNPPLSAPPFRISQQNHGVAFLALL